MTAPLCINCKHHVKYHSHWCKAHTHVGGISPVDGEKYELGTAYCAAQRASGYPCGPDGKLFEPIPEPEPIVLTKGWFSRWLNRL